MSLRRRGRRLAMRVTIPPVSTTTTSVLPTCTVDDNSLIRPAPGVSAQPMQEGTTQTCFMNGKMTQGRKGEKNGEEVLQSRKEDWIELLYRRHGWT